MGTPKAAKWSPAEIIERLAPSYGPPTPPRRWDATSELVYTILSQHTSDANSVPAYEQLRRRLKTWDDVVHAKTSDVMEAIRQGGLARQKAPRIQQVLRLVKEKTGGYDLSFLGEMPVDEARAWLRALPGVGPKTVGCVMLFALEKPVLPVDTHIYRVAKRLGLYKPKVTVEESHDVLEAMLQPQEVLPFHMYLITHGRRVCDARKPLCGRCVLEPRCPKVGVKAQGARRTSQKAKGVRRRS